MKKLAIILAMPLALSLGCQKEFDKPTIQETATHSPEYSSSYTNPFESVGTLHNEAMDYVVTYLGTDFKTKPASDHLDALESFAISKSEPFDITLTHAENIFNAIPTSGFETHIANRISVYQSSAGLSSQAASDIEAMFDELFKLETLGFSGYSTIASNITSIEEDVYNDSDYDSNEKDIVLKLGAMLRHSLSYWINVAQDSTHPRHGNVDVQGRIGEAFADACAFIEDLLFDNVNGRPKDAARYASNMYANTHG